MNTDYTHITFVVDRSGSMESTRDDAQGGIDHFLKDQKSLPQKATLTIIQFDEAIETAFGPADIQRFESYTLVPRGSTALLDALGRGIVATGEYLAEMAEADRPGKVIFVVVTDGQENASVEYRLDRIKDMVEAQKSKYSWEFIFIGSNIDAVATGNSFGIQHTAQYAATGASTRGVYRELSSAVNASRVSAAPLPAHIAVDEDGNSS